MGTTQLRNVVGGQLLKREKREEIAEPEAYLSTDITKMDPVQVISRALYISNYIKDYNK